MALVQAGRPTGSNLDVANAIRDYLTKANGDTRLALAMSVADSLLISQNARAATARPLRPDCLRR